MNEPCQRCGQSAGLTMGLICGNCGEPPYKEAVIMKMTKQMFEQYVKNPLGMDEAVRNALSIPEDKYYSVSVWPPELEGNVYIVPKLNRKVTANKISKSNQT